MNSLKLCRALGLSPDQLFQRAGFLPAEGDTERDPGAVGDDEPEAERTAGSETGGAGAEGKRGPGTGSEDG